MNNIAKQADSINNSAREMTIDSFDSGEDDAHDTGVGFLAIPSIFAMQDSFLIDVIPFGSVNTFLALSIV